MWRLRVSLLPLADTVDPEADFAGFRACVAGSHVGRVTRAGGREVGAMFCYQPIDGEHAGQAYRLALFEYGCVDPRLRGSALVSLMYARLLLGCRSVAPGRRNYVGGVGYPRSAVLLQRAVPDLRLDGDPSFDALERALLDLILARRAGFGFDPVTRVVELPTRPPPLPEDWLRRNAEVPIFRDYVARVPDWRRGRALALLGRHDGAGLAAFAHEVARRLLGRPSRSTAARA